jgi:hypothetical protein
MAFDSRWSSEAEIAVLHAQFRAVVGKKVALASTGSARRQGISPPSRGTRVAGNFDRGERRKHEVMTSAFSAWQSLDATAVSQLPNSPGVFEIANLVRTTLYIGAAAESLVATLTTHLGGPTALHARAGRLYFRHAPTEDAERVQAELLARYGECHSGMLPPGQSTPPLAARPQRHLKAV